ncbi:hypothetical protein PAPYR_8156 [Paratrimastix pyriformis]|uniref:F-box domain-containing protein n=1 Tax=Paratrimastix pyriformis TaxID=342808 RepID=A0ABQ8UEP2_9EUKA|nr:hypothetical protein PAPYR_8156 [Paratrimastix pyriformis]
MDSLPADLTQYAQLAGTCRAWKTVLDSEDYWTHLSKLFRSEPPPAMRQHPNFSWKLYFRHSVTIDRSFPSLFEEDLRFSPSGRSCECLARHSNWSSLVMNRRFQEATVWLAFGGQADDKRDKWRAGFVLEPRPVSSPNDRYIRPSVVAGRDKIGWGFGSYDQSFGHEGTWSSPRGFPYPNRVALGLGVDKDRSFFAQVRIFSCTAPTCPPPPRNPPLLIA